jgi:CubicO group peptidase (beta-lactamase class C family)
MIGLLAGIMASGLQVSVAQAAEHAVCGAPETSVEGWPTGGQEQAAVDPQALCGLIEWLDRSPQANVHSVLVVRRGALVFEHYRSGTDEQFGSLRSNIAFGPRDRHDLRSVSKSVTSLLVGIAVDRKLIASIDEPVYRFFPEFDDLRSPERDRITVRHLLTMSSGLEWNENVAYTDPANSEIRMWKEPDPYRFAWDQNPITPTGTVYNYNGGSTELLGQIVRKVTGQELEDFAQSNLFAPLGIEGFDWYKHPNGKAAAASGLRLSPRDMAKLGQLILWRGRWGEKQIVSEDWVRQSIMPHIGGLQLYFYGYQWWLGRSLAVGTEVQWVAAVGLGGQRIFVVPDRELVVVMTAGLYKSSLQTWVPLTILNRVLQAAK